MADIIRKVKKIIFHPILFAIYPVLFFYTQNQRELILGVIVVPITIAVFVTFILWVLYYFIYRSFHKSALLASFSIFLLFFYGPLYGLIDPLPFKLRTDNFIIVLFLLLFVVLALFLRKIKKNIQIFTNLFTIFSFSIFLFSAYNIVSFEIGMGEKFAQPSKVSTSAKLENEQAEKRRDIYYIILDAYGRDDILKSSYDYDNKEFIEFLERKDFYIASKSASNYAFTRLSLPSTFNFQYIDEFIDKSSDDTSVTESLLRQTLQNNKAAQFLKSQGYKFINFSSGWGPTDKMEGADINISKASRLSIFGQSFSLNEFYVVFLQTTALSPFIQDTLADELREKILYNFGRLAEVPYMRGDKFILAHFVIPHPPYLFDENGNSIPETVLKLTGDEVIDKKLYIDQLKFVNKKTQALIEVIFERSNPEPIIIIAADHGPLVRGHDRWPEEPQLSMAQERMSILNAYYFPDGGKNKLNESVTPVNTFRLLFNHYFGTEYEILPNLNFFSYSNAPFEFYNVTDQIQSENVKN